MELIREIAVWAFLVAGSVFCVIGAFGVIRMPDFYTRTHAASITDTLGATLILLGLAIYSGPNLVTVKLLVVLLCIYITSPTAGHALVKAAYSRGLDAPDVEEATGAARAHRNASAEEAN
ncbi:MAG: monovalent cation/H(+) antiporter subunit G [Myxococcota bacterium]